MFSHYFTLPHHHLQLYNLTKMDMCNKTGADLRKELTQMVIEYTEELQQLKRDGVQEGEDDGSWPWMPFFNLFIVMLVTIGRWGGFLIRANYFIGD